MIVRSILEALFTALVLVIKIVAIGYMIALTLLFVFQRVLIFNDLGQYKTPAEAGWPDAQIVNISPEPNVLLHSWFTPPSDPHKPVIVTFLGQGGWLFSRAHMSVEQHKLGYGALVVGYPGYNRDQGHPSETTLYAAARANITWLRTQGYPPEHIVLVGESLGTGVATQMATEYPVAGLILEMPYTRLCDAARAQYGILPTCDLMFDRFATIDKIALVKAPLLVIHGRQDHIVPFVQGQAVFNAATTANKTACMLDDANHFTIYRHGGWECQVSFLEKISEMMAP